MDAYQWQDSLFQLEKDREAWPKLEGVFREGLKQLEDVNSVASLYRSIIYAKLRYAKLAAVCSADDDEDEEGFDGVASLFQEGYDYIKTKFAGHWDSGCKFLKNYAYFAFNVLNDISLGRKLWKDILGSGVASKPYYWIEATEAERRFGSVAEARTLLYRGVNSVYDNATPLFEYFVQFEREEGNFDQMQKALKKINDQAAKINEREAKMSEREAATTQKGLRRKDLRLAKFKQDPPAAVEQKDPSPPAIKTTRKRSGDYSDAPSPKKYEAEVMIKDKDGFVIPPIPVRLSPRREESPARSNGGSTSPAVRSLSPQTPPAAKEESSPAYEPPPTASTDSDKTVFVSNLDYAVTEEALSSFFPGNVGIRLIPRAGTNLSKGYGYVDFATAQAAKEALALDRQPFKGRPVFVSENKPHGKGEHAVFKYATSEEQHKLFVRNLPYKCNNEQLMEAFSVFGLVKDARIVTRKDGVSKCCGYIEFESAVDAAKAMSAQIEIGGRNISVAISNPPKRSNTETTPTPAAAPTKQEKKPHAPVRKTPAAPVVSTGPKPKITGFVPRAVVVKKT